jgi:endonuclease/exonuclease/phosphatase family metal-dependent hydrolase
VLTVSVQDDDERRLTGLNSELRRIQPDIAIIQKVNDPKTGLLERVLDGTGLHGTHQNELLGYVPPLFETYGGNVIATRWDHQVVEVFEARYRPETNCPWCSMAAVCQIPGEGEMLFIGTTGIPHFSDEWAHERQVVQLTDLDARHRRELPTVIAGDFNAMPETSSIRYLSGRQSLFGQSVLFHDAWTTAGEGPGYTWGVDNEGFKHRANQGVRQPNYRIRIDYVFVGSSDLHPDAHAVIESVSLAFTEPVVEDVWPSDHFGVTVDLEIGRGPGTIGL